MTFDVDIERVLMSWHDSGKSQKRMAEIRASKPGSDGPTIMCRLDWMSAAYVFDSITSHANTIAEAVRLAMQQFAAWEMGCKAFLAGTEVDK